MQLFLSYADLPSLGVIKCDEVALDLVEDTWTSRSGIECRLVIQLTRDSRVYIARGVRDTLLAVISSPDAIHARARTHARGDVTQCIYSRMTIEIYGEWAQVPLICVRQKHAIRPRVIIKFPPGGWRKNRSALASARSLRAADIKRLMVDIPTTATYLRKDRGRAEINGLITIYNVTPPRILQRSNATLSLTQLDQYWT